MKTIQIQIAEEVTIELLQVAKELNKSTEEVIKDAVDKYLALYNIHNLRNQLSGVASKLGFTSEEEIFNAVS